MLNIVVNDLIITPVRICHSDTTHSSQSKFWSDVKFLIKSLIWLLTNYSPWDIYINFDLLFRLCDFGFLDHQYRSHWKSTETWFLPIWSHLSEPWESHHVSPLSSLSLFQVSPPSSHTLMGCLQVIKWHTSTAMLLQFKFSKGAILGRKCSAYDWEWSMWVTGGFSVICHFSEWG